MWGRSFVFSGTKVASIELIFRDHPPLRSDSWSSLHSSFHRACSSERLRRRKRRPSAQRPAFQTLECKSESHKREARNHKITCLERHWRPLLFLFSCSDCLAAFLTCKTIPMFGITVLVLPGGNTSNNSGKKRWLVSLLQHKHAGTGPSPILCLSQSLGSAYDARSVKC